MLSKRIISKTLLLLTGMSFLMVGCGDEGQYSRWDEFYPSSLNGFRVLFSDPDYMEELVPTTSNIIVRFNEQVDPTSLVAGVRIEERSAGGVHDITDRGVLSTQNGDTEVIWQPNLSSPLVYGAFYQMTLSGSLRSVSGRSLVATTYVPFYTGTSQEFGPGVLSLPGNPQVQSTDLQLYSDNYGQTVIGINITFNEDIQDVSSVRYRLFAINTGWDWFDRFNVASEGFMSIERNQYAFDNRSFIAFAYLPQGVDFTLLSSIEMRISDAIDMQSQHMGPYSQELNFWD